MPIEGMSAKQNNQETAQIEGTWRDKRYIDVYSPRGKHKVRIFHPGNHDVRIESNLIKRMELEHIEDMIDSMSVIPDFGYETGRFDIFQYFKDQEYLEKGQEPVGWHLFWEYINNAERFERLSNFVQMRHEVI